MGAWSASVTGNDTAQDLIMEYQVAFSRFTPDEAVRRLDDYVRTDKEIDERDAVGWCDYRYSLADFMWKKGVLTETVRSEALALIDGGAGLEEYAESGLLKARQRALAGLSKKLVSTQPPRKKISLDWYTSPVFALGDVIALQLLTATKPYFDDDCVSEAAFRAADGKYVALRKVMDSVSCTSKIDPEVRDTRPCFQLYDRLFDAPPAMTTLRGVLFARGRRGNEVFFCEGRMRLYERMNCVIVGRDARGLDRLPPGSELLPLADWKFGSAVTEILKLLRKA